jgi:hypothetical protein
VIARELRELLAVDPDGRIRSRLRAPVEQALMEGTTQAAPDFSRIIVPALSIYAYPTNFDYRCHWVVVRCRQENAKLGRRVCQDGVITEYNIGF